MDPNGKCSSEKSLAAPLYCSEQFQWVIAWELYNDYNGSSVTPVNAKAILHGACNFGIGSSLSLTPVMYAIRTWDPGIIAGVKTDAEELIYTCFFGLHQRSIKPETLMTLYDIQWDPGILRQIAHLQLRFSFVLHVHDPGNFQSGGPYSSGDGVLKSFLFLPKFYMLPLIEFECEVYLVTCAMFLAPSFRVQILRRQTVMSLLLLTTLHLVQDFEVHFSNLCRPMGAGSPNWNYCHRLSLPWPITGIHVLGASTISRGGKCHVLGS